MKRVLWIPSVLALALALVWGCAERRAGEGARSDRAGAELSAEALRTSLTESLERCWLNQPEPLRVLFETQLEYGAKTFGLTVFMELTAALGQARVVGMTEMGLKLFDVSVTQDKALANSLAPNVRKPEELVQIVAGLTRRVFLHGFPSSSAPATSKRDLLLVRQEGKPGAEYAFELANRTLFKADCASETCGGWRVSYLDYQAGIAPEGLLAPKRIRYEDLKRGMNAQFLLRKVSRP
jgi:hypothetical protein